MGWPAGAVRQLLAGAGHFALAAAMAWVTSQREGPGSSRRCLPVPAVHHASKAVCQAATLLWTKLDRRDDGLRSGHQFVGNGVITTGGGQQLFSIWTRVKNEPPAMAKQSGEHAIHRSYCFMTILRLMQMLVQKGTPIAA